MNNTDVDYGSPTKTYYTIIVSGSTFRLSNEHFEIDEPNLFTIAFSSPKREALYIDRDPEIFKDIVSGKEASLFFKTDLRAYKGLALPSFNCRSNICKDTASFRGMR
jgi:hypothetical protein